MNSYRDLLHQSLKSRATVSPDSPIFILETGREPQQLLNRDLYDNANRLANFLIANNLNGHSAVIMLPASIECIVTIAACILAGVVLVPVNVPASRHHLPRLLSVVRDCSAAVILTNDAIERKLNTIVGGDALKTLPPTINIGNPDTWQMEGRGDKQRFPEEIVLLQYTSGTTSAPKGVLITDNNLWRNLQNISRSFLGDVRGPGVQWMPFHHDMGLVGGVLQNLIWGDQGVILFPMAFLQRPLTWLTLISKYRAVRSGGPNFAFELCIDSIRESQCSELDLSCWKIAYCGAEMIHEDTLERFARKFQRVGFSRDAFVPCYGMAEATLLVSSEPLGAGFLSERVDAIELSSGHVIALTDRGSTNSKSIVSCGKPADQTIVEILDDDGIQLPENRVGEIFVRGEQVSPGYWDPQGLLGSSPVGKLAMNGFRTGDLGFLRNGRLFVTGRAKDLIIVAGRNIYLADIEAAAAASGITRLYSIAAFAIYGDKTEKCGVACEIRPDERSEDLLTHAKIISGAIGKTLGVLPWVIVFTLQGMLPRTSSGKIRRHDLATAVIKKDLKIVFEICTHPDDLALLRQATAN